jgi:hypothetical protein
MRNGTLVGACLSYGVAFDVNKVFESAHIIGRIASQPKILSVTAKQPQK